MQDSKQTDRMNSKSGQGMTEYIIIIAVVAIASIIVFGLFGNQIKDTVSRLAASLRGEEQAATDTIQDAWSEEYDMGTFQDGALTE